MKELHEKQAELKVLDAYLKQDEENSVVQWKPVSCNPGDIVIYQFPADGPYEVAKADRYEDPHWWLFGAKKETFGKANQYQIFEND